MLQATRKLPLSSTAALSRMIKILQSVRNGSSAESKKGTPIAVGMPDISA
jgi:hypothetical protein